MMVQAKSFLERLSQRQDLVIALFLVTAVSMMVLPMPTVLVDVLIGFNLGLAVLLLMVAVYLESPLDFSALPGVILISTVFRLSLSITTTRLILVQADAGAIVQTFGEFVIAGSVIVGMVVFLIITIVQFVVITKGSERVAEVGARFTLDALPGKQMSIDSDLRNGDIDQAEARRRRHLVEKESQLYGAMDGAMKFVKGDAIAGLIIIAVNLIGGIAIGTLSLDLPLAEAVTVYSLLTIGDALISQIPALFLSITAATIVTRVQGEKKRNLGGDIVGQLMANPRALRLASGVLLGMGLVPGFPLPVFICLSLAFAGASLLRRGQPEEAPTTEGAAGSAATGPRPAAAAAAPVTVALSPDLAASIGLEAMTGYAQQASLAVAEELGIPAPGVAAIADEDIDGHGYRIDLEGIPAAAGEARPDRLLIRDDPEHVALLDIPVEQGPPAFDAGPSHWVDAAHRERLREAGIGVNDCGQVVAGRLRAVLRRNAGNFLGIQETKTLLSRMEGDYGELLQEALRVTPIQRIADVLRRMLEEGVSIGNLRLILESLVEWSEKEPNPVLLTEYVRSSLGRQICHRYADARKVITAYVLERQTEDVIRQALRKTSAGVYLALDDHHSDRIVGDVRRKMAGLTPGHASPVILTTMDLRRFVRNLLMKSSLDIPVLSYQDLAAEFSVQPMGTIGADEDGRGRTDGPSPRPDQLTTAAAE